MKKIKEYIHNHPKLKTTLKVLATIGVIFSVGFNILIIGVASCSNTHVEKTIDEPTHTKETKSAYNKNGSTFIGLSELVSFDYYTRMIDNLTNYEFVYDTGVSVSDFINGTSVNIITPNMWIVDLNNDGSIASTTAIETINLDIDYVSQYCTRFRFTFAFANQYSVCLEGYYYFNDIFHTEYLFNTFIYETTAPQLLYWDRSCLSFAIGTYTSLLPSGTIGTNYNKGYAEGYQVGKSNGYDIGFQDGLEAYEGGANSPFGLIRSAFESIASILNIQILPNLSLGLVLFAPVIVAIIIVLFKMIRG